MVYGVTYLIYGFSLNHGVGLDYKNFSSMPYGVAYPSMVHRFASKYRVTYSNMVYRFTSKYRVTHSNVVHGFSLGHKEFSSMLYTLVYSALPRDLVRVPPLGYLISLSMDHTSHPPAGYIIRLYIEYIWSRYLQALKPPLVHPYSTRYDDLIIAYLLLLSRSTTPKLSY